MEPAYLLLCIASCFSDPPNGLPQAENVPSSRLSLSHSSVSDERSHHVLGTAPVRRLSLRKIRSRERIFDHVGGSSPANKFEDRLSSRINVKLLIRDGSGPLSWLFCRKKRCINVMPRQESGILPVSELRLSASTCIAVRLPHEG